MDAHQPGARHSSAARHVVVTAALLATLVFAGCAAPTPAAAPAAGASGGLLARSSTVDLGRVPFDKMVEARYELTNTSARAIKLTAPPGVKMLEGC